MAQDRTSGSDEPGKNESAPADGSHKADLTDEELQAVVGGAVTAGINLNATGLLYRR